jgi:hypothetical protein
LTGTFKYFGAFRKIYPFTGVGRVNPFVICGLLDVLATGEIAVEIYGVSDESMAVGTHG